MISNYLKMSQATNSLQPDSRQYQLDDPRVVVSRHIFHFTQIGKDIFEQYESFHLNMQGA